MNGTVFPLTLGVGAFGVCVALAAWTLVQRHGDRRVLPPAVVRGVSMASLCHRLAAHGGGQEPAAMAVAEALAATRPVEIVSVDSALVYRGMDIGTAKPGRAERARVPHHLIDILDPAEAYSAARFVGDAERLIAAITARGHLPLLVGGTMLYFKALFEGLDAMPAADRGVRAALEAQVAAQGLYALYEELQRVDPVTAARLPPGDAQRIQRALEVFRVSGRPMSQHHGLKPPGRAARSADLARAARPRLAARAHRAALPADARRWPGARSARTAHATRARTPTCRRCAASATARPGRRSRPARSRRSPNAARRRRASSPSASSRGCAACPSAT